MILFDFAFCMNYDLKINELAQKIETENWGKNNRILKNYINYYFNKIYHDKIYFTNENVFLFNTGLLTKNYEEVYAKFIPNKNQDKQKWFFQGFFVESRLLKDNICNNSDLPGLAKFFNNFNDLYFDPKKEIILNKDHILNDRNYRISMDIPKEAIIHIIEGEIKTFKKRLARNYRLAVPQYYNNQIQFLLPLTLGTYNVVNALVVVLENDHYMANTIFTIDMAYNNARLLMKPESDWLTIT